VERILKCLVLALMFCFATQAKAIAEGDLFPEIKIDGYKSGSLSKSSMNGKVTVINFWATWCEACKVELKEMEQVFAPLLRNDDFQFSFVALDKDPSKAEAWVKANMIKADQFMNYLYKDPKFKAAETLAVDSFPMTLIIGKDGRIKFIQRGFKEGEDSTRKLALKASNLLRQ